VERQAFGSSGLTREFPEIRERIADGIACGDVQVASAGLDDILVALHGRKN
jgi:hypothetical protein